MVEGRAETPGGKELRRIITIMMFFSLLSPAVQAEEEKGKPSSVDLMVPPVIINIERSDKQDLSIIIPDFNDLKLPDLGIKLPDPADITIKELPSDIPLPSLDTPQQQKKASFFTEGNIGTGFDNQLIGDVRLFKLGTGTRFSLLFSHDSLDGYGYREAGEGYSYRKELFEGALYGNTGSAAYTGEGSLQETENGLQEQSSLYTSVIHRFRTISLKMNKKGNPWGWQVEGNLKSAQKVLTGSTPLLYNTFSGSGKSSLHFMTGSLDLALEGSYHLEYLRENDTLSHRVALGVRSSYHFRSFDAGAFLGASYVPESGFFYPFSLFLRGTAIKTVQVNITGGRKVALADNYSLWENFPFAGNTEGMAESWYSEGQVLSPLFSGIDVYTKWDWEKRSGAMNIPDDSSLDPLTGLFLYGNTDDWESLLVTGGVSMDINRRTQMNFEWKGQLLRDTDPRNPLQDISAGLLYRTPGGDFRGSFNVSWGIDPVLLPSIGGDLSLRIHRGIFLDLRTEDLLPLVFQEDRTYVGPYSAPSGKVTVSIKISL